MGHVRLVLIKPCMVMSSYFEMLYGVFKKLNFYLSKIYGEDDPKKEYTLLQICLFKTHILRWISVHFIKASIIIW
jgi:hypothetical protein